jgi:hypothetical protein
MNAGRRATVRGPAARVLLFGATKPPDEAFNITVAMVLAVLYELSLSRHAERVGKMAAGSTRSSRIKS